MLNMKKENGQSLVEFALVIPILLILVFGIIEFGMLLSAKNQLEIANFAVARMVSLGNPAPPASSGVSLEVTYSSDGIIFHNTYSSGDIQVKVIEKTNYTPVTSIISINVPLSSTIIMTIEQPPKSG